MPLTLNKVHEFAIIQGQSQPQLVGENHYIRLRGEGAEYPLYIQAGQVFAESGPAMEADELPEWFTEELRKCSPQALAAAGWHAPTGPDEMAHPRRR